MKCLTTGRSASGLGGTHYFILCTGLPLKAFWRGAGDTFVLQCGICGSLLFLSFSWFSATYLLYCT